MQKWIYGLASYSRKAERPKSKIEAESGTLPMEGFLPEDFLYVSNFLKKAGELGWELAGILEPYAAGSEISVGPKHEGKEILAESADLKWLLFKRPSH